MGKPKKQVDFELVDKLLEIQCTQREVLSVIGVSKDTLKARIRENFDMSWNDYAEDKRRVGKTSLRRAQFQKAVESGNATMLIWLGKQMLGQSDKQEIENTNYEMPTVLVDDTEDTKEGGKSENK